MDKKFELVYKTNGRVHPYKEGQKYNTHLWGFRSIETEKVFDTPEEAAADKKKRAPARKKAI